MATVVLMDLWLLDVEAPYKIFVALGKFNYGVALSYIAAYIFYLITVHYPETKSAISIYTAASFPAKAIVTNIESIVIDMGKKLGNEIRRENINEEIIKETLSQTMCYGDSTVMKIGSGYNNWIEYFIQKESVIKSFQQQLRPLYPKMDSEYIAALSSIEQDNAIYEMRIVINAIIALGKCSKSDICFSNGLEDWFIK